MFSNIGPLQLLIVFLIVLLIFGTKKLRNMGGDLGSAIRDFRKGMSEDDSKSESNVEKSTAKDAASGDESDSDKTRNAGS